MNGITLQQLLHDIRGSYELNICRDNIHTGHMMCNDVNIPDEHVNFREYVPGWDAIKGCRVKEFTFDEGPKSDMPGVWIEID